MSLTENHESIVPETDVAVIGMACRLPSARDVATFWDNLCRGVEGITFLSSEELEPSAIDPTEPGATGYVRAASMIEDPDCFDAAFFGYSLTEAELMDPQQRLLLQCAWHALEDAGYDPENCGAATGVFAGARTNTYLFNIFSNPDVRGKHGAFEVGMGNDLSFLSSRISYKLNLRGPSYSIQSACSTSLVAVHLACGSLLAGECDMALAGAASVNVPQRTGYLAQRGGILSHDGHCRAFDDESSGTIFGSGLGVVVLKRLADALSDRDHIYAVIKGSATNNDGAMKASFAAPGVHGQLEVIDRALAVADLSPETITYVEAHGTGTRLGDPIEVRALTNAFRRFTDRREFCALGSVKTNLGHLDAAAGIAGLIKTVLSLHHGKIPPTLHFQVPNPQIDFASTPFYVNTQLRDWHTSGNPRRAAVSAFGIGGANAHVILEEAPTPAPLKSMTDRQSQVIPLSARSDAALDTMAANLEQWLERNGMITLSEVAHTLHLGRKTFDHRRVYLAKDVEELRELIRSPQPDRVWNRIEERSDRPVVFLFPGQGVKCIDAGRQLYESEEVFRKWFDHCSELMRTESGWNLRDLLYPSEEGRGEAERRLEQTEFAQPALFSIEYSLAKLWMHWGVQPAAMAGHSLGEYVAAALSGVMRLEDALKLVAARGRLMQGTEPGAMLALHLDEVRARSFIMGSEFDLAAVNSPGSCVVAGPATAVAQFEEQLREAGLSHVRLQTSRAFHSRVLSPMLDAFSARLGSIQLSAPIVPFVSNLTGTWITAEEATSADYWVRHARETVRFLDDVMAIASIEKPVLIEVGPGNTLQKLAGSCLKGLPREDLLASLTGSPAAETRSMLAAYGQLWLAGANLREQNLHPRGERNKLSLPGYPFDRTRYWIDFLPEHRAESRRRKGKAAVQDWFHTPGWQLAPPQATELLPGQSRWLLFMDEQGVGEALSALLRELGHEVFEARSGSGFSVDGPRSWRLAPDGAVGYERLTKELPADDISLRVVHLWTVTGDKNTLADGENATELGYYSLLQLLKALVASGRKSAKIALVADHLFQSAWDDRIDPTKALVTGLAVVAPQEVPGFAVRCIDVRLAGPALFSPKDVAEQLLRELGEEGESRNVALRSGRRWVQRFDNVSMGEKPAVRSLRKGGVYLITGGLGSVGTIIASYLARQFEAKLVLTTRSTLPGRDEWDDFLTHRSEDSATCARIEGLRRFEAEGASVMVSTVDVTNEQEMKALIDRIHSELGGLHGVIHAAGITSGESLYRSFTEFDRAESEMQFAPKVLGTEVLERVLRGLDLDFCLLLSSNASVLGGLGYTAYAAANAYLDAFALERARHAEPWISASWDPWPRETKKYQKFQTSMDKYAMNTEEAEDVLHRVITGAMAGHILVVTGDMDLRLKLSGSVEMERNAGATSYPRPAISTPYIAPESETEKMLASIWCDLLGVETVGTGDNFFELGGHSLLAMHIMSRIREEFQVELPMTRLFEDPTIASLAVLLVEAQSDGHEHTRREILDFLNTISDEQAEAEILKRTEFQEATAHQRT